MKKIALIYSDYYPEVTSGLKKAFLDNANVQGWTVEEFEVFGVSEFPFVFKKIANLNSFDGVAVLGCVVEGETYHNGLINSYVFNKLYDLSLDFMLPLGYAILNVKKYDDALMRSKPDDNNRGLEAFESLKLSVV
jgi:6,7-dimethyl-8-ribityllumazine synthase